MNIGLTHYLVLSVLLFGIGLYGTLSRRHAIVVLMCIELMLNAANLMLVAFSRYVFSHGGQAIVIFSLVVAAAEASVGLAIIISFYRQRKNIDIKDIDLLKW